MGLAYDLTAKYMSLTDVLDVRLEGERGSKHDYTFFPEECVNYLLHSFSRWQSRHGKGKV